MVLVPELKRSAAATRETLVAVFLSAPSVSDLFRKV